MIFTITSSSIQLNVLNEVNEVNELYELNELIELNEQIHSYVYIWVIDSF